MPSCRGHGAMGMRLSCACSPPCSWFRCAETTAARPSGTETFFWRRRARFLSCMTAPTAWRSFCPVSRAKRLPSCCTAKTERRRSSFLSTKLTRRSIPSIAGRRRSHPLRFPSGKRRTEKELTRRKIPFKDRRTKKGLLQNTHPTAACAKKTT